MEPKRHAQNIHATLVRIASHGVLITGRSGSGKTSLALHLLEHCKLCEIDCALVSDDQILVRREGDSLIGIAPPPIAGRLELPHFGIVETGHEAQGPITLAVQLLRDPPRICEAALFSRCGIDVPLYRVPARNETASARIVLHLLQLFPW